MLNRNTVIKIILLIIFFIFLFGLKVQAASNNALLKEMIINKGKLSPDFSFITTEYFMNVSKDVGEIEIIAITDDDNAKVSIKGNDNLKEGLNIVTITVTAEDGSKKVYNINIAKGEVEEVNASLKELSVQGHLLVPAYTKDRVDYVVELKEGETQLDITAIPENDEARVEIKGNKNLSGNYDTITIIVTAKDLKTTKTYTINVVEEIRDREEGELYYEDLVNDESINIEEKEIDVKIIIIAIVIIIVIAFLIFIIRRR